MGVGGGSVKCEHEWTRAVGRCGRPYAVYRGGGGNYESSHLIAPNFTKYVDTLSKSSPAAAKSYHNPQLLQLNLHIRKVPTRTGGEPRRGEVWTEGLKSRKMCGHPMDIPFLDFLEQV